MYSLLMILQKYNATQLSYLTQLMRWGAFFFWWYPYNIHPPNNMRLGSPIEAKAWSFSSHRCHLWWQSKLLKQKQLSILTAVVICGAICTLAVISHFLPYWGHSIEGFGALSFDKNRLGIVQYYRKGLGKSPKMTLSFTTRCSKMINTTEEGVCWP
jgi:hypothetical protein